MPSSTTDILGSDLRGELDGLRLLVEETEGSVIAFVRYRRVTEREAGVRYLKEQLSLPVAQRVLSEERKNPLVLLDNLPAERCCVQFYDLEAALPEVTGYLNVNREAYAEVPHALVFWVGEHGLREVATNAPDFWAWRSGVFDVRHDELELSQSMSQAALADDVQFTDRGDLERRADLYEGLIEEYEGEDEEYVARLRLKLSSLYWMLRDPRGAEEAACEAMAFAEQEEREDIASHAYHNLGMVALMQRKWEEAEKWHRKSAEIKERLGDDHGRAETYHQLGIVAQREGKWEDAEEWYRRSLEIKKHLDDNHGAATYHQLGRLAQKRRDLADAEKWYRRAAEISERFEDEHGASKTYHQLGVIAQQNRNLEEAEKWYQKSSEIEQRLGDHHGAALTYAQRGRLAREQRNFHDAGEWFISSIKGFRLASDSQNASRAATDFAKTFLEAPSDAQDDLRRQWLDAGLPKDELDNLLDQHRTETND